MIMKYLQRPSYPKLFEEKLQAYDPQTNINQAGCDYIKQLYTINEDIFETLNQSLLQPKYTENFFFCAIFPHCL